MMAARLFVLCLGLVLGTVAIVYQAKQDFIALDRRVAEVRKAIVEEKVRIQKLNTEWASLTREDRLSAQAPQLGLVRATPRQIVSAETIGQRDVVALAGVTLAATLPSGEAVEVRFKPMTAGTHYAMARTTP